MALESTLVSVIVPTRNSGQFLDRCLSSIASQTHRKVEIIVVDNYSSDETCAIAKRYTSKVYSAGPERSAQVNFGAQMASGAYLYKVDSDFVLNREVIEQCLRRAQEGYDAVVVHNSPDTSVSWIACVRKFEVDMYKYDLTHSSARFVRRDVFDELGGYDSRITAGEDYDFQNRLVRTGRRTGFVEAEATHLGEPTSFRKHMSKYFWYGADFVTFTALNRGLSRAQLTPFRRVYLRNWKRFICHPILGFAFIGYSVCKFTAGGSGFVVGSLRQQLRVNKSGKRER